jgi:flagellar biosynthesis/type III secretory pathway chaperone
LASKRESQDTGAPPTATQLLDRKLTLLQKVLDATRSELLLVELDGLAPLVERKDKLIAELTQVDQALESLGTPALEEQQAASYGAELTRLVEAILDNQRTLETRMDAERERLRKQLRDLDHQAQVRGYLERQRPRAGKVDLTR